MPAPTHATILPPPSTAFSAPNQADDCKQTSTPCGVTAADPWNDRLAVQVGSNGRFNIGAFPNAADGSANAASWDLSYSWPGAPWSSFTTIRVNDNDYIYGTDGTMVQGPTDNSTHTTNTSTWRVGGVEVTQVLQLVRNTQTNQDDVAKIEYRVQNISGESQNVGSRIMLDTELNYNDGAPFRVPGIGIVTTEREFTSAAIPDTMQTFFGLEDSEHVASSTFKSGVPLVPDRLILAHWRNLYNTRYMYTADPSTTLTTDSAYAVAWNSRPLAPGATLTFVTYYGLAQLNVDLRPPLALGISAPATLAVNNDSYEPNPFDLVATVFNTGDATATNVQVTLNLTGTTGLTLDSGTRTQAIGDLAVGAERQVTWRVQAAPQSVATTIHYAVIADATNTNPKTVADSILLPVLQPAVKIDVTDANGNPITAVVPNPDGEGWPLANPLTIKVTPLTFSHLIDVSFSSPTKTTRFNVLTSPLLEPSSCGSSSPTHGGKYTWLEYKLSCARSVPPGIPGTLTWKIWLQPSPEGDFLIDVALHNPELKVQRRIHHPALEIRPVVVMPGFLGTFPINGVWTLDPIKGTYRGLITELEYLGYENNVTILPYVYHWHGEIGDRSRPNDLNYLADDFNAFLNAAAAKPRPSYVRPGFDIVAHSTSGLITRAYASRYGTSRLHSVFFVATPHQGSVNAYAAYEGLDPMIRDNTADNIMRSVFNNLAIKAGCYVNIINTGAPGVRQAPDNKTYEYIHGLPCIPEQWDQGGIHKFSPRLQPGIPLMRDLQPTSGAPRFLDRNSVLLQNPPNNVVDQLNANADAFVRQLTNQGGHIYNFHSEGLGMLNKFNVQVDPSVAPLWMGGTVKPIGWDPEKDYEESRKGGYQFLGSGDGDVADWSGRFQDVVRDPALKSEIVVVPFNGVSHIEYFLDAPRLSSDAKPVRKIAAYLLYPNTPAANLEQVASNLPLGDIPDLIADYESGFTLLVQNLCPVTMLVTDPLGRRIGTTPDGRIINEIANSLYTGHETGLGPDMLWYPEATTGVYTITITGLKSDFYQISAQALSAHGEQRLGIFSGYIQVGETRTFTTAPLTTTRERRLLLVDDAAGTTATSTLTETLKALDITPTVWNVVAQGDPHVADLYPYDTVLWATGNATSFTTSDALNGWAYVQHGGSLLLTGQDVDAGITESEILSTTLRAQVSNPTVSAREILGGDLLAGLKLHLNGGDSANNQQRPSALAVWPSAISLGEYSTTNGQQGSAGLRYATNVGQLVYLSFGLEGLQSRTERRETMRRLLAWLETGEQPAPNTAPQITALAGPEAPLAVQTVAQVTATFSDSDNLDSHSCTINWNDGSQPTTITAETPSTCTASHVYTAPGVYSVTISVVDAEGATDEATFQYIVVYNPEGGFVTGGGWIASPPGAYMSNPALEGRATFGFVARYKKGAMVPDGQTQFNFHVGSLKLQSTSYEWLVVAGSKAQYKGVGTINSAGNYGFLLTAVDAGSGGTTDTFRLKIWDKASGTVVYDNQHGADINSTPTTTLGGGNITIQK